MRSLYAVAVAAALLAAAPAVDAQESSEQTPQAAAPVREAVPRSAAPRTEGTRVNRGGDSTPAQAPARRWPDATRENVPPPAAASERRAAEQRGHGRGDNPQTGTAVPRGSLPPVGPPPTARSQPRVYVPRVRGGGIYGRPNNYNYYFYPRAYYPYGYGAFGLGYFYYDPYTWGRSYSGYSSIDPYLGRRLDSFGSFGSFGFDTGELKLRVSPRDAQVFVDGYYAGLVNDFDGAFQGLKLEAGPYHVTIVAPGYETLEFDVRITRGQDITYRQEMRRIR